MKRSFEIESDCLDIVKRIRAIDKEYFVVFDFDLQKYQLHHRGQRHTYCLTFPFETLDERAVNMVLQTRVQNADELFREMEEQNKKLQEKKVKEVLNDFKERKYDS